MECIDRPVLWKPSWLRSDELPEIGVICIRYPGRVTGFFYNVYVVGHAKIPLAKTKSSSVTHCSC